MKNNLLKKLFFYSLISLSVVSFPLSIVSCSRTNQAILVPHSYLKIKDGKLMGWSDEVNKNLKLLNDFNTLYIYDDITEIDQWAFLEQNELKTKIPSNIKNLWFSDNCKVTKLLDKTFKASQIENVYISKSIQYLGNHLFALNEKLRSVKFSSESQLKSIGSYAFIWNTNLKDIVIPNTVIEIGEHCFDKCLSLEKINIPEKMTEIKNHTFNTCRNLSSIDFSKATSLEKIGVRACAECEMLKNLNIPDSVKTVDDYAFEWCVNLQEVRLSSNLEIIGRCGFSWCLGIKNLNLPQKMKKIDEKSFLFCLGLESVTLPECMYDKEGIYDRAFYYCNSINKITLLKSILTHEKKIQEWTKRVTDDKKDFARIFSINEPKSVSFYEKNGEKFSADDANNLLIRWIEKSNKKTSFDPTKKQELAQPYESDNEKEKIDKLREILDGDGKVAIFSGAGMSTESNIPDFRSKEFGLYKQKNINDYNFANEVYLSEYLIKFHPAIYYDFLFNLLNNFNSPDEIAPNMAHIKIANWAINGKVKTLITQNLDDLHEQAKTPISVIHHLHGRSKNQEESHMWYCLNDHAHKNTYDYAYDQWKNKQIKIPKCDKCGGIIRPDMVLYSERLDEEDLIKTVESLSECDTLIVAGTSLAVYPAVGLINFFCGKNIILINSEATVVDIKPTLSIKGKIAGTLEKISLYKNDDKIN